MDYVELHCHSAYSFLDGASDPSELAAAAAELGHESLALTDHDNVCGAMEFAHACHGVGVRPIVGCELTVECQPPGPRVLSPRHPPSCGMVIPRMGPAAVPPAGGAQQVHVTLLVE
jgi:DNA polymerase III alpha subunit